MKFLKDALEDYLPSSYKIGAGYQDSPFLWYNYGTKSGTFPHN